MYKVIYRFADKLDKDYIYEIGNTYPREGVDVTDERLAELASNGNAIGQPIIEEIMEEPVETEEESVEIEEEPKSKRK